MDNIPSLKITSKKARDVINRLDEIIDEYKAESETKKRDWGTYEQQLALAIKNAIRDLEPLIKEAIEHLRLFKAETRGRKQKLTLEQKVIILLIKHMVEKSNREMENMMILFSLLSDIEISYKSIERLYSDDEVHLALVNLHTLIMNKKGVNNPDCSGDGTGYSLTISKHYASVEQKLKDKANEKKGKRTKKRTDKKMRFVFSFKIMDLETRLYLGYGTSMNSEKEAYNKAIRMLETMGINSLRLDKYYSNQKDVRVLEKQFGKDISIYLIPKKNTTLRGSKKWKDMIEELVVDPKTYLGEYYRRNQSESAFSEDKRRFGWGVPQRRPDRVDTHNFCTTIWHNMLWLSRN